MKILKITTVIFIIAIFASACNSDTTQENKEKNFVLIKTKYGNMKFKLYDETPKHKANFIKLINKGFYNDLLFHRVINEFMIQGGDPESKNAETGKKLGSGGPGYTIDAEINPKFFHKKGVLVTARQGDAVNPEKKSSGSQFYIVQGRKYTDAELDVLEYKINTTTENRAIDKYVSANKDIANKINKLQKAEKYDELDELYSEIKSKLNLTEFKIDPKYREAYKTIGGIPFLDGQYTIFGEIIEGMEVIDKIANLETDENDRPIENIVMQIEMVE